MYSAKQDFIKIIGIKVKLFKKEKDILNQAGVGFKYRSHDWSITGGHLHQLIISKDPL